MEPIDKKQASVKQVQFLEAIEQRTGVKYNGTKWSFDEVSEFLSEHSKRKQQDNSNQPTDFKAKNPYNSSEDKKPTKITDKQRQYIKVLENKTGVFFSGKTFDEADSYIKTYKN